jgi:sugar fermentation stimulation protein A
MILNLNSATLIKRYKRFLADIAFNDLSQKAEQLTTIHVANTGAMTGCADSGNTVFYSTSDNPKRKYPFSWEISQNKDKHFICVNTLRANQLVEEALNSGVITELSGFSSLEREVKYGSENSRIDFLLKSNDVNHQLNSTNKEISTYIEVKSVTLLDEKNLDDKLDSAPCNHLKHNAGQGYFPDAVSTRGQKHLRELITMAEQGHRAVLLFAVLHSGINKVSVAKHIDKKYAELFIQAQKAGVEILIYKASFIFDNLSLDMQLNERITLN